jgi:dihydroxynaphthoic acid synthetase
VDQQQGTPADIVYEKSDGRATIAINRPEKLNAFRDVTVDEMSAAFEDAAADSTIGVVVVTGLGGGAFSTGGDMGWESGFTPNEGRRLMRRMLRLSQAMRLCGKPVIAAVDGYCVGGGNELHLLCDLSVATERSRFGQVGPRMGSSPIWYGTQLLQLSLGDRRAREVVYFCRQYGAREAEEMGWVNKVVPDDRLEATVDEWCEELLDKSSQSLRVAKASFNVLSDLLLTSVVSGFELLAAAHGTEEFHEGVNAFLEKRPPDFRAFRGSDGDAGRAP